MAGPPGSEDVLMRLISGLVSCRIREALREQRRSLEEGRLLLYASDLVRCGARLLLGVCDPGEAARAYTGHPGGPPVAIHLLRRGILGLMARALPRSARSEVEMELEASLDLPNWPRPIDCGAVRRREVFQGLPRRAVIRGTLDAFIHNTGEVVLLRYSGARGGRGGLPRPHHLELAAILQWLASENGLPARAVRIVYYNTSGLVDSEYVVRFPIGSDAGWTRSFEENLARRILRLLEDPRPLQEWECSYCPLRDSCPLSSDRRQPPAQPDGLLPEAPSVERDEIGVARGLLMRGLARLEAERAGRREPPLGREVWVASTQLVGCPVKAWLAMFLRYHSVAMMLQPWILRGEVVHEGIRRVLDGSHRGPCKRVLAELGLARVEVEKRLDTILSVEGWRYRVVGYADIVLHRRGGAEIIELKTHSPRQEPRSHPALPRYEDQLRVYMAIHEEAGGDVRGAIVFAGIGGPSQPQLNLERFEVDPPGKGIIEGLVSLLHEARRNPSALVERARSDPRLSRIIEGECRACPFRALCPVEKALRGPRRGGGSV